ncbi:MFS transporter [Phenylobacterium sp. LH3H17]|uniref:MFS transporter n=1 Tax=Phenylobacterium sp. LH3H17 TaxID=2903901 RepID=UPI0020C98687|nr:MFS transporter [Phenylobacterium sp. LH3H17]UTP38674.1 MFS transporter [Phenylobacterium sp. LH3H17]
MTTPGALWRDRDFARLWAAQAVSAFGARITREGLPIMAVVALGAGAATLGLLAAVAAAAAVFAGLAGGGYVDRVRRRPLLIAADLVRAGALIAIPLAAAFGVLTLVQVFAAAAIVAGASVVFDIASHAYLPGLIGRAALVDGNSRLASTEAVAEVGGPALAGMLFQWLTAPFAVAVNAATYLASAGLLALIRAPEPARAPEPPAPWLTELTQGFRLAWAEARVRALLLMGIAQGLFGGVFSALYILFALRTLNLPTSVLGLAIAAGGVGALAGAWLGPWLGRRLGVGPAILAAILGAGLSAMAIPLAPTDRLGASAVLIATQISGDALAVAAGVLTATLRQTLLPQQVLGRVAGAFHASAGGVAILGALAGGAMGGLIGPRLALFIAAVGFLGIPLIGALSPLRQVRKMPAGD